MTAADLGWNTGSFWALRNVDLELRPGTVVGIVGLNGAGKTTLLRLLAQVLAPSEGTMAFPSWERLGWSPSRIENRIAYVPQIPTRYAGTLEANLKRCAGLYGLRGDALRDEVAFVVERFRLGAYRSSPWWALSGGYRTRFELAIGVLRSPDLLILDEPLGPLDVLAEREYLQYLRDLADSRRQVCIVLASHSVGSIADVADDVLILQGGSRIDGCLKSEQPAADDLSRYEIRTDADPDTMSKALASIRGMKLHRERSVYLLTAPRRIPANEILGLLIDGEIQIFAFRNLEASRQYAIEETLERSL
jgi:ABC-type multidrug transport system ATPase subunit